MRSAPIISPWLPEAVADVERLVGASTPALRRELGAFLSRLGSMNGGTSLGDVLSRPASTPFVPLIDACAADLGLTGDPRVGLLGRSTVMLYAYVRLQDDIVDEPALVPREAVYAAEALLGEHLALFAAAVPDARAFVLRTAVMHRFAEVAAAEVAERGKGGSDSADWIGGKALPIAVPLVAMAVMAGRPALADTLERFVTEAGTGLQLINDLYNAQEDADQGRPTPVLRWLGAESGTIGVPLRALLLSEGSSVMERALREARAHVDTAEALALAAGLTQTAKIAVQARAMVDAAQRRLLRLLLNLPVS